MNSFEIRIFSESIRTFINNSHLPAEAKKFVLKDILDEVGARADAEIMKESERIKRKEGKNAKSV